MIILCSMDSLWIYGVLLMMMMMIRSFIYMVCPLIRPTASQPTSQPTVPLMPAYLYAGIILVPPSSSRAHCVILLPTYESSNICGMWNAYCKFCRNILVSFFSWRRPSFLPVTLKNVISSSSPSYFIWSRKTNNNNAIFFGKEIF